MRHGCVGAHGKGGAEAALGARSHFNQNSTSWCGDGLGIAPH